MTRDGSQRHSNNKKSVCTQFHLVLDERILGIAFSLNTTLIFIEKHRVQKV
jgi:hypothetical protein